MGLLNLPRPPPRTPITSRLRQPPTATTASSRRKTTPAFHPEPSPAPRTPTQIVPQSPPPPSSIQRVESPPKTNESEFSYEHVKVESSGGSEFSYEAVEQRTRVVSETQVPDPNLPTGWTQRQADNGAFYYVSPEGITQWDAPPLMEEPPEEMSEPAARTEPKFEETIIAEPEFASDKLPAGWRRCETEDGTPYYFTPDDTTQWEAPPETLVPEYSYQDVAHEPVINKPVVEPETETTDTVAVHERDEAAAVEPIPADQPLASVLPDGWSQHETDDGATYYISPDGTPQWEPPMVMLPHEEENKVENEPMAEPTEEESVEPPETTMEPADEMLDTVDDAKQAALPEGWIQYVMEDGTPYYQSPDGTTQWNPPVVPPVESEELPDLPPEESELEEEEIEPIIEPSQEPVEETATEPDGEPVRDCDEIDQDKPSLPEGWIEHVTDDGTPYYQSPYGTTQWEPPKVDASELDALMVPNLPETDEPNDSTPESENPVPQESDELEYETLHAEGKEEEASLPDGWKQFTTDDGTPFYMSPNGTSQWEKPQSTEFPGPDQATELKSPEPEQLATEPEYEVAVSEDPPAVDFVEEPETDVAPESNVDNDSKLPDGWMECVTEDGTPYYTHDGPTQWDTPQTFAVQEPEMLDSDKVAEPEDTSEEPPANQDKEPETTVAREPSQAPKSKLPEGWKEYTTEDGALFYVAPDGTAQWEPPENLEAAPNELPYESETDVVKSIEPELSRQSDVPEKYDGPLDTGETPVEEPPKTSSNDIQLPDGWKVCVYDDGTPFYVSSDGHTQWDPPEMRTDGDATIAIEKTTEEMPLKDTLVESELIDAVDVNIDINKNATDLTLPEGWTKHTADDGTPYCVGPDGTTTWEAPKMGKTEMDQTSPDSKTRPEEHDDDTNRDDSNPTTVSALPEGWVRYEADDGTPYYIGSDGTTTWERPSAVAAEAEDRDEDYSFLSPTKAKVAKPEHKDEKEPQAQSDEPEDLPPVAPSEEVGQEFLSSLPAGWTELTDPATGHPYFVNDETGETTWDRPVGTILSSAMPQTSTGPSGRKPGRPRCAVASFGFGGRFCMLRRASGVVVLRRTHVVIPTDAVPRIEAEKKEKGILGPLNMTEKELVSSYLQQKSSSDMLWHLVYIASLTKGKLMGSEMSVVKLLLTDADEPESSAVPVKAVAVPDMKTRTTIERLLLHGQRERAIETAMHSHDFAMALLIASLSDRYTFYSVAQKFAEQTVESGDPLTTVGLLLTGMHTTQPDPLLVAEFWNRIDPKKLRDTWKSHLALILSNPVEGKKKLILALGDRLCDLFGETDVDAAHFCYMAGGFSVGRPGARMTLLGLHISSSYDFNLTTERNVEAFARTEAYEWAKRQGNPAVSIPGLHAFRVMYATILADYGFFEAAKQHLDSVIDSLGGRIELDKLSLGRSIPVAVNAMISPNTDTRILATAAKDLDSRLRASVVEDSVAEKDRKKHATPLPSKPRALAAVAGNFTNDSVQDIDSSFMTAQTNSSFMTAQTNVIDESFVVNPPSVKPEQRPPSAPILQPKDTSRGTGFAATETAEKKTPVITTNREESFDKGFQPFITPAATTTARKPAPMSAPANLQTTKEKKSKKSFFDFGIKKKFTKMLNPEATEADLGEGMQAYYDEKLKVWVFPGEDPVEVAKPIGPPPTAPSKPAEPTPDESKEKSDDPLAQMMAPPSSRIPARTNQKRPQAPPNMPTPKFFIPSPAPARKSDEK